MTIFGNKSEAATELIDGPPGFVSLILWVNGIAIGDATQYGAGGHIGEALREFRLRAGKRIHPSLFEMSARECLDTVYGALFGRGKGLSLAAVSELSRKYSPFLLSPNFCESLDDYLIVAIAERDIQRVVTRHLRNGEVADFFVPFGSLECAFEMAEKELILRGLYRIS